MKKIFNVSTYLFCGMMIITAPVFAIITMFTHHTINWIAIFIGAISLFLFNRIGLHKEKYRI